MKLLRKINTTLIFLLVQLLLYFLFLGLDILGGSIELSNKIKFIIIILCFCYVLFYKKSADKSILLCVRTALFFTVISDIFLLLLDYYFYGVLTFIIVQQLYGVRIDAAGGKERYTGDRNILFQVVIRRIFIQIILTILLCYVFYRFGIQLEGLLVFTTFYFISILTNVIRAVIAYIHIRDKNNALFALGMVLFLLCDINVGLFNLSDFIPLSNTLYATLYSYSALLMWAFYAPSQILIALSIR